MQDIIRVYDTNVFAVIRMAKAVIPHMASRRRGTIVNISSIDGEMYVLRLIDTVRSSDALVHMQTRSMGRRILLKQSGGPLAHRHVVHGMHAP